MTSSRTNESIVVATFNSAEKAENAIEELHNVGFTSDQIRYSRQFTSENFLESIKDLLIFPNERQDETASDIQTLLQNMGIGQEELQHYENTYRSGNFVVVVRSDGRDQEARTILKKYDGAGYNKQS
ncbi:MAG: hypothetical protein JO215_08350 [Ktedonobacteraceae bacterium]|nr:hypothetical protein [Ktedonobacteraceae bacterium]MBV9710579.1 hypothetical protein [Ktedonobacteraceae bacterium]